MQSKLSYDKIVHSTDQSDYVGLPPNPCDYVTSIGLFVDMSSGSQPFPVMKEYDWSMSGPENEAAFSDSTVSDPSLAQISSSASGDMVTFLPPNDGATHTVTINPVAPQEIVTNCVACSGGDMNVASPGFDLIVANTFWTNNTFTPTGCTYDTLACTPGTTPTCQPKKWQVGDSDICPPFAQTTSLVVTLLFNTLKYCIDPPVIAKAALGPGDCN